MSTPYRDLIPCADVDTNLNWAGKTFTAGKVFFGSELVRAAECSSAAAKHSSSLGQAVIVSSFKSKDRRVVFLFLPARVSLVFPVSLDGVDDIEVIVLSLVIEVLQVGD
ncbi:hypothetical protein HAX54_021080 [Datura stramonium]|uniref:Uncharacterized protein n=1 Tax=Datura stramonium TaxID=4076 RepID=A0ABS8UU24_DATST|nr:hypothetical protein [Datura stramonium]